MKRDEIVMAILPTFLAGSSNLGSLSEEKRRELFALVSKIAYELADELIKASKEPSNG